ncbi:hypothetical protein [Cohnella soli]|uniref:Uncharacterized protein n=1 Tax=Cohnella soli TaxID=425005 RepID=A0ABW0HT64_9BACL
MRKKAIASLRDGRFPIKGGDKNDFGENHALHDVREQVHRLGEVAENL